MWTDFVSFPANCVVAWPAIWGHWRNILFGYYDGAAWTESSTRQIGSQPEFTPVQIDQRLAAPTELKTLDTHIAGA